MFTVDYTQHFNYGGSYEEVTDALQTGHCGQK